MSSGTFRVPSPSTFTSNVLFIFSITSFSDTNWAASPNDRKPICGYCVFLKPTLVSWSSKKQAVIAGSSTESEYRALSHVACEIMWLRSLLHNHQVLLPSILVTWYDNLSAATFAYNSVFHARTKHIEIDAHFVRDQVLAHQL